MIYFLLMRGATSCLLAVVVPTTWLVSRPAPPVAFANEALLVVELPLETLFLAWPCSSSSFLGYNLTAFSWCNQSQARPLGIGIDSLSEDGPDEHVRGCLINLEEEGEESGETLSSPQSSSLSLDSL